MEQQITDNSQPLKLFCRKCGQKLDVSLLEPFSKQPCPMCGTQIRVPQRFGRYLLEKICGIGGMSKVYRAIDPETGGRVAVKILDEEFHAECSGGEQFLYESQLVAQIKHPGVIPIFDCGICDNSPYLVMRYMAKGSLEAMQKNNALPTIPVLAGYLYTVADGLYCALQKNILHHDVKPGNILVDWDDSAALGDFDLADMRHNIESKLAATGWASPGYVSTERLLSGKEDYQGDIFSLGVSAFELMTGVLPFGTAGDTDLLLERRKNGAERKAHELNADLSRDFSDLLDRMLNFYPAKRPEYPEIIRTFGREANLLRATFGEKMKSWFFRK